MKKHIVFITFGIAATLLMLCLKNEKIVYGDNIETIQSEFPNISGIESCRYRVEKIGSSFFDFIGPSNYHLTAVIIIDSDEMNMIVNQYEGEKRNKFSEDEEIKIAIEQRLIDNTSIDDKSLWTFNQEFRMRVLGWRYVGDVYYLERENAIYIDAENL